MCVTAFSETWSRCRAELARMAFVKELKQAPGSRSVHTPLWCVCLASTAEHACYDPKDSELCLARAKPQETGVEARSRCDVQIHGISWA